MLNVATILKHYKNKDIQRQMVNASRDREVAVRFLKGFFGKRPDSILYPGDVLEFAKKQVSSFHVSEEIWGNVNMLSTGLDRKGLDKLRKGWDYILDVDCPDWNLSRIVTHLLIKALKAHGISSISLKFSGNKGFHIAVPYQCFPSEFMGIKTSLLFPEIPRIISEHLLNYIEEKYVVVDGLNVIFDGNKYNINDIAQTLDKDKTEMYNVFCSKCDTKLDANSLSEESEELKNEFVCSVCGKREFDSKEVMKCDKCDIMMDRFDGDRKSICDCGGTEYYYKFNAQSVIEVDTLLISTRHLYRLVYSLHEKSGLASIPIENDRVLEFEKEEADPNSLDVANHPVFLDENSIVNNEASGLLEISFKGKEYVIEDKKRFLEGKSVIKKEVTDASGNTLIIEDSSELNEEYMKKNENKKVPELKIDSIDEIDDLFPPCIKLILKGLADGKKRATFVLINFFRSIGLNDKDLENVLIEWNKRNAEPLSDSLLLGQLRYRTGKEVILPPNCDNASYYKDLGVCKKDELCSRIKNPVNYYFLKYKEKYGPSEEDKAKLEKDNKKKSGGRPKLTEEQLAMRRAYREKLKKEKQDSEKQQN